MRLKRTLLLSTSSLNLLLFMVQITVFIRHEADHWLPLSVTHLLTDCCLVDLTDVTLAFEDANSKCLDVNSVADADAKECVDNRLYQIL